jgi:hypothetical protein
VRRVALRLRPRRPLKAVALLLNLGLFAMGVFFELHPRDREDAWSAGGVAAVAVLNSAALTVPVAGSESSRHTIWRLRRVAGIANLLLLLVAAGILAFELLDDGQQGLVLAAALALPFFTLLALREQQRG